MSATDQAYVKAHAEVLATDADPADMLEALVVINRLRAVNAAQLRNQAWACGRKGDAIAKVSGLTETLTGLLRRFAACGIVRYADMPDLYRHVSALRKALKTLAPEVKIETAIGEGYEVVEGFDGILRLLHDGRTPSTRVGEFTPKQTVILRHLAARGSAHVDQFKCLQRHMSNIRSKLPKQVVVETHSGEGLYTITKGRDVLTRILAGEVIEAPKKPKAKKALKAPAEPARIAA